MKDKTKTDFVEYLEIAENDIAAAILVLADVLRHKRFIDEGSAENLAHELAIMLKEITLSLSVEFPQSVDVNADIFSSCETVKVQIEEAK